MRLLRTDKSNSINTGVSFTPPADTSDAPHENRLFMQLAKNTYSRIVDAILFELNCPRKISDREAFFLMPNVVFVVAKPIFSSTYTACTPAHSISRRASPDA